MSRFDRYMLSQLMVLFGFFALVLVAVYWVNRAVVLFDQLIADGQSAGVFLEFTILSLPNVIRMVLPMATFAATVYVTNRLSSESELTVMQATGFSPWRLARPVFFFGILIALMMAILTNFLVPTSMAQLAKRQKDISDNVTARLLTEGTFLHPAEGITFYIREITPEGVLHDVFLSDKRDTGQSVTYTAQEAYLIKDTSGPKLIMIDGLAQAYDYAEARLYTTQFSDFTYDISGLLGNTSLGARRLRHFSTWELLTDPKAASTAVEEGTGWVMEELHGRFNQPLMCLVAALIGFSTLLTRGFSRFGVWRQIVIAFILLVLVEMIKSSVIDPVRSTGTLWPIMYLPTLAGITLSTLMLGFTARPFRFRRRVNT